MCILIWSIEGECAGSSSGLTDLCAQAGLWGRSGRCSTEGRKKGQISLGLFVCLFACSFVFVNPCEPQGCVSMYVSVEESGSEEDESNSDEGSDKSSTQSESGKKPQVLRKTAGQGPQDRYWASVGSLSPVMWKSGICLVFLGKKSLRLCLWPLWNYMCLHVG